MATLYPLLAQNWTDVFSAWQLIPLALLIALLIFWKIYRNKQM